ncbi:hypothetical protein C438_09552 [Haloferax denitrificans ATCC 35960]|uniref:Uncharacterized protein n=2 Tax=Haloferax denitrificans TaxID=35745 RepID=M0JAD2_9EURY|nr:hypothetical protein C438_09552 [Haloferax denitrificans ATCC 35960]
MDKVGGYEYVEELEADAMTGTAELSSYSEAELEALRNELLGSPAVDAVRRELRSRRTIDDEPSSGSTPRSGGGDGSGRKPSSEDEEYIDGYEGGVTDDYIDGYEE